MVAIPREVQSARLVPVTAGGASRTKAPKTAGGGSCPAASSFELLGRRWVPYVIWALRDGPRRFTEILRAVPGITDRVLTMRLRDLEAARIVARRQFNEIPPRVEYDLTERGRDLMPVIGEMERWSRRWDRSGR